MITRVRFEAEGSSAQEVEEILSTAHDMFANGHGKHQYSRVFGVHNEAFVDSQTGEFVIERFAREGGPADGAIVYRGRSTAHYAKPARIRKLNRRADEAPYSEA